MDAQKGCEPCEHAFSSEFAGASRSILSGSRELRAGQVRNVGPGVVLHRINAIQGSGFGVRLTAGNEFTVASLQPEQEPPGLSLYTSNFTAMRDPLS